MATIAKGSAAHQSRVEVAKLLRHFAVKYGMTTKLDGGWVLGYSRPMKKWLRLYHAW